MSEELGSPRGYVGTLNIALDRALGSPGIPLGRITEISGWPGAGKSTMLDQIIVQCQVEGGIAVLADTERSRNRKYMEALGVHLDSLIFIGGRTVETMFEEVETLVRQYASSNAIAWCDALVRAGVKCPAPATKSYKIMDPGADKKRPRVLASFSFAEWGYEQAGALLAYQQRVGLPETSVRDTKSREALRPVIIYGEGDDAKQAADDWEHARPNPLAQPADRPVVVGWDSVAGTPTDEELEGAARDVHPATAAKVIRRNLRRLVQLIDDEAIALVLVNQRYERIRMGYGAQYGPSSETYGGGGIKYHTTIRIEVDKVGDISPPNSSPDDSAPPLGQIVRIRIPKNKVESPFHEEEFGLVFGRGAENAWALYTDLKTRGIIRVGGGWSHFTDPSILGESDKGFRGWPELSNMLAEDPALWRTLRAIYLEARG